jgi:XRE family transcriptional regulator, fatty acid utilization regulator
VTRAPIGYRLRERRKALAMTQTELAAAVGISASYVNLIEHDKRSIGGGLLARLARTLGLDLDSLTGAQEARLIQALGELAADPVVRDLQVSPLDAPELIGRFPEWARAILALYRAYRETDAQVASLSDRLSEGSHLAEVGHQILTHITSIRSSAEILQEFADLGDAQRRRFLSVVSGESGRLAEATHALFAVFAADNVRAHSATPADEVDDFFIDRRNHFPTLETAADGIRSRIAGTALLDAATLADYLQARHGVACRFAAASDDAGSQADGCHLETERRLFHVGDRLPPETVRFQLAGLIARLEAEDAITTLTRDERLTSGEARERATRALAAYAAGAVLFPYAPFLEAATALRYDLGLLQHRFRGSFEQVCHRLVTLRSTGASGIPFAFMRADPAGNVTKRFSIPGLSLPRFGAACPLWAIYQAQQAGGRTIVQLARMPDDATFLFIARWVTKRAAAFGKPVVGYSVMICCEAEHAKQVVLADGLDPSRAACVTEVGTSCRLCSREDCAQRAHPPVLEIQRSVAGMVKLT